MDEEQMREKVNNCPSCGEPPYGVDKRLGVKCYEPDCILHGHWIDFDTWQNLTITKQTKPGLGEYKLPTTQEALLAMLEESYKRGERAGRRQTEQLVGVFETLDKVTSDLRMHMPMFCDRDGVVRLEVPFAVANPFMKASARFCQLVNDARQILTKIDIHETKTCPEND